MNLKRSQLRGGTQELEFVTQEAIDEWRIRKDNRQLYTNPLPPTHTKEQALLATRKGGNTKRITLPKPQKPANFKESDPCYIHTEWSKLHTNADCYTQHPDKRPDRQKGKGRPETTPKQIGEAVVTIGFLATALSAKRVVLEGFQPRENV